MNVLIATRVVMAHRDTNMQSHINPASAMSLPLALLHQGEGGTWDRLRLSTGLDCQRKRKLEPGGPSPGQNRANIPREPRHELPGMAPELSRQWLNARKQGAYPRGP